MSQILVSMVTRVFCPFVDMLIHVFMIVSYYIIRDCNNVPNKEISDY